jgi:hypothetical protein
MLKISKLDISIAEAGTPNDIDFTAGTHTNSYR